MVKIKEKTNKKLANFVLSIVLGIAFTFIFFEIGLFAFGKLERIIQKTQNKFFKKDEFVILALGESTTAHVYDLDFNDYSWPAILEKILNEEVLDKKIKVINEGEVGIDSNKILNDLDKNIEKYNPDLVISIMGINDFFGEVAYETAADIEADGLLSKLRTYKLIKFLIANVKDKNESKTKKTLDCDSEESCLSLAFQQKPDSYLETELAIKFLEKTLDYNPNNLDAIIELGLRHMFIYTENKKQNEKTIIQAIGYFEKALEYDKKNPEIYLGLADSLIALKNLYPYPYNDKSENKNAAIYNERWSEKIKTGMEKIKKDVKKYNIQDAYLFLMLSNYETCSKGTCCEIKQVADENESKNFYFKKALEFGLDNPHVLFEIARYHAQCGNVDETENFYLKILDTHTNGEIYITTLIELANIYLETNREKLANEIFKQAIDMGGIYVKNYKKLHEMLASKNIQLIAAQYPMRSVEPLELIFKNNSDVLLVDNELIFKNAVKEKGYEQIFIDRAAGNFGHCSEEGNLLLAENIASVILDNWEEIGDKN